LRSCRTLRGDDVPDVDVGDRVVPVHRSSLAGGRKVSRASSREPCGFFPHPRRDWGPAPARVVMLENVPGFATSHGGRDLEAAVSR